MELNDQGLPSVFRFYTRTDFFVFAEISPLEPISLPPPLRLICYENVFHFFCKYFNFFDGWFLTKRSGKGSDPFVFNDLLQLLEPDFFVLFLVCPQGRVPSQHWFCVRYGTGLDQPEPKKYFFPVFLSENFHPCFAIFFQKVHNDTFWGFFEYLNFLPRSLVLVFFFGSGGRGVRPPPLGGFGQGPST